MTSTFPLTRIPLLSSDSRSPNSPVHRANAIPEIVWLRYGLPNLVKIIRFAEAYAPAALLRTVTRSPTCCLASESRISAARSGALRNAKRASAATIEGFNSLGRILSSVELD